MMERIVQQCPTVDRPALGVRQGLGEAAAPAANGHGRVFNRIIAGDARAELPNLPEASIDLSFWSPPYYVGKSYERHLSFDDWRELRRGVIHGHSRIVKPGGFLAVNIGDILCSTLSLVPAPPPRWPSCSAGNGLASTRTRNTRAWRKGAPTT